MNLLTELNEQDITIVIVTHEPDIATKTKRTIRVQDGYNASPLHLDRLFMLMENVRS